MAYCMVEHQLCRCAHFFMILMLIDIQVRVVDLSGTSVYRQVDCHDLTSHQHMCKARQK